MIPQVLLLLKKIWDNRKLATLIVAVFVCMSFYIYYLRSENKIQTLSQENKKLEQMVEQQKVAIESLKKDYTKIIQIKDDLNKQVVNSQKTVETLRNKLHRENEGKRSLEELATKKTSLIERLINNATEKVLRCFELISEGKEC